MKIVISSTLAALALAACVSDGTYRPASENLPGLKVRFLSADRDGRKIPEGEQCRMYGGIRCHNAA